MASISLFHGLNEQQVAEALRRLVAQRFGPGDVLLREGDRPFGLYVIQSGSVDILVHGEDGRDHLVDREGPGATLGEMSLVTGQPVSATVRASSDVVALFMSDEEFGRVAARHPVVFRNLGALLATRLQDANRRALKSRVRPVTWLVDLGAPPLLGYALACSLAWHTRATTALVVVGESEIPELRQWAEHVVSDGAQLFEYQRGLGARLILARPEGAFSTEQLAVTLGRLVLAHEHLLIQTREGVVPQGVAVRRVGLTGTGATAHMRAMKDGELIVAGWREVEPVWRSERNGVVSVPEPCNTETEELRQGLLSLACPAGQALGFAARELAGMKVGLALGAGSQKGYAHVGVLRVLERAGVPLDCLAGTSAGSGVVAGYVLAKGDLQRVADLMDDVGGALFRPWLPRGGLLSSAGLKDQLRKVCGSFRLEDSPLPMAVVAADLITKREVVFKRGLLWAALLASMSIPGLLPAQPMGGLLLVDGGVVNPVPSRAAALLGANVVIGVKLEVHPALGPVAAEAFAPGGRAPSLVQTLSQSIEIMQSRIFSEAASASSVVIEPDFAGARLPSLRSFTQGRRYIELGESAAEKALPRIAEVLPWVRVGPRT